MFTYIRLFAFITLAATLVESQVYPGYQAQPNGGAGPLDLNGVTTDVEAILSTVAIVDQKSGVNDQTPPNQPPPDTMVTAVDGALTNFSIGSILARRSISSGYSKVYRRQCVDGYDEIFSGTGTGPNDRDAAIEGTAFLTYTLVDNSTYNVDACLAFCDTVQDCVFANLYYEFNNPLFDFVFSQHSNLVCAVYADIHTAAEKTNTGGQQLEPPPAGLTYIQQSSGWGLQSIVDPNTPDGYSLVFGPTGGANNAPGYMGFAFIDKYDVQACADLCNTRNPDPVGGGCQYFNIWRALVNGIPTTYTCAMYYIPTDASTAVNTGQGDLTVTYSRGYRRVSILPDGGFEGYTCGLFVSFCYAVFYNNWGSVWPRGGFFDASIFHYQPYAHSGSSLGILGAAFGTDSLAGTLTPAQPLQTEAGKNYSIQFFHASSFNAPNFEKNAFVEVLWNGQTVATFRPGYSNWTFYQAEVLAQGNDLLGFYGGAAPAYDFIDDISVFLSTTGDAGSTSPPKC